MWWVVLRKKWFWFGRERNGYFSTRAHTHTVWPSTISVQKMILSFVGWYTSYCYCHNETKRKYHHHNNTTNRTLTHSNSLALALTTIPMCSATTVGSSTWLSDFVLVRETFTINTFLFFLVCKCQPAASTNNNACIHIQSQQQRKTHNINWKMGAFNALADAVSL